MMNPSRRLVALMLAAASGLGTAACKEGVNLDTPILVAIPDFVPATVSVSQNYITVHKGPVKDTRITAQVVVGNVSDPVSGIAIKLRYPKDFSRFVSCSDGALFPVAGTCYSSETAPGSGEVFLARTIQAPQTPVSVSGEKVVLQVEFLIFGKGSGDLVFEAQNLGGGDASALLDANGDPILVTWFSGQLAGK